MPWKLLELIDNTKGYSGTWTAPDVFGDGQPYDLGVYMIGGGGSGGFVGRTAQYGNYSTGGASGYGFHIVLTVTPGDTFPWVVGVGGASVVSTQSNSVYADKAGNNGGTTSFGAHTAQGGGGGEHGSSGSNSQYPSGPDGGQGTDSTYFTSASQTAPCGGRLGRHTGFPGPSYSQSSPQLQNPFDPTMLLGAAGGNGTYYQDNNTGGQQGAAVSFGKAGSAKFGNSTLQDATGYGNGGGAGGVPSGGTAASYSSGKGSDGAIFLYARKKVPA